MKIFKTIKFFMNPAPYIFLSCILGFLNLVGVVVPIQIVFAPVIAWFVYFCLMLGVFIWAGYKAADKVIDIIKACKK